MAYTLNKKSLERLDRVHPDIAAVVKKAISISEIEFCVTEGMRSLQRQEELFRAGASTTMKSRHLTGHAVDLAAIVGGDIRWDWPLYYKIADAMIKASVILGIKIEWGGNWKKFKDGPHFQLPWESYP